MEPNKAPFAFIGMSDIGKEVSMGRIQMIIPKEWDYTTDALTTIFTALANDQAVLRKQIIDKDLQSAL
ncbi:MAG: hypothetical protein UV59_C0006G0006 [Candidatus Gottesmanbacteria bacterium GW2011_GWA1_43_11]|uniref:Uncharacterized protein n=1 Tax=Candidatus Gottesmanbacteria bacterium GW2011_GWA1_43_11 TaxID=1618436 RepID=A0A0G1CIC2_9BACT|nr:MAG: hypothetical protein UV59_C0006G0006 [Candidatus Gottesmanbacteria bacterium GW2011_GWA1_43_11]